MQLLKVKIWAASVVLGLIKVKIWDLIYRFTMKLGSFY